MINNEKKTPPLKITYPLILENVNDLICIVEPDYDYKFQLINESTYVNILGYSSKDLIGESFLNYMHLDDVKYAMKILKKSSTSIEGLKDLRFKAKNGKFLWFEIKVKKYEENNQKQIIIILRNISERKNLEDKFKAVENKVKELTNLIPEIRFWKLFYPKKYEEALRASYQMLQMVMDNIPEYLFWKDTNNEFPNLHLHQTNNTREYLQNSNRLFQKPTRKEDYIYFNNKHTHSKIKKSLTHLMLNDE